MQKISHLLRALISLQTHCFIQDFKPGLKKPEKFNILIKIKWLKFPIIYLQRL